MKKLFIILFLLTVSFRVAAQNEQTKDSTLLNRFPTEMGKEPEQLLLLIGICR